MQVLNRFRLRDFWTDHPHSERHLRSWFQLISSHDWESAESLRATFPHLQEHGNFTAFNVYGGTYFLIAAIDFDQARVYVRKVLLHTEFRNDAWKQTDTEGRDDSDAEGRSFMDLLSAFLPRPIRDEDRLRSVAAQIDSLLDRAELTTDERDYLDLLTLIVADYERRGVPVPPVSGTDVLRSLLSEHRLSQVELIPLLGSKSKAAAVLRGERSLELRQVSRASRYFNLPPESFMDPDDLEIEEPPRSRRRG